MAGNVLNKNPSFMNSTTWLQFAIIIAILNSYKPTYIRVKYSFNSTEVTGVIGVSVQPLVKKIEERKA